MATKRVVIRTPFVNELGDAEQQDFVDDVTNRLEGTGINGYFVACEGNAFIEWEGEDTIIDDKVDEHLADDRLSDDYVEFENKYVESTLYDGWYGHATPDAQNTL